MRRWKPAIPIRFINGTPDDNLALVIYRNGVRIASSTAQVGTAQSVVIPSAENDTYQVYVVDGLSFGSAEPSPVISYEGLSQRARCWQRLERRAGQPQIRYSHPRWRDTSCARLADDR